MATSSAMTETPVDSISTIFKDLRGSFNSGKSKSLAWRKRQIEQVYKMCDEQKEVFASACNADFYRPSAETLLYDCGVIRNECIHVLNHIDEWACDQHRSDSFAYATMDKYVHPEPYGICLIIGAWNYPFQLTLAPLLGAIAAGNCAIVKPSELAPNSAAILATMVGKIIMKAAAEKMIPVVLECGGKSPVYIADDANLAVTATRVAWGKTMNCGQTC